jgi:multidrug efflux system outer membrane protein
LAFGQVEDNLSTLRLLKERRERAAEAVKSSTGDARISRVQYTNGAANFLDVLDSERTALQAQSDDVQLAGDQAVATVRLIRALGGEWGPLPQP